MKLNKIADTLIDLHFPRAGVDIANAFAKQPNRPVQGVYCRTTPLGRNVRGQEAARCRRIKQGAW